jgi:hypothetical protein
LQALVRYREIFGPQGTPELIVYNRGSDATNTLEQLAQERIKQIGILHKGTRSWRVAEAVRDTV